MMTDDSMSVGAVIGQVEHDKLHTYTELQTVGDFSHFIHLCCSMIEAYFSTAELNQVVEFNS